MALGPGSLAFVGFNGEGADNLAFVLLEDISAGTEIHFTDNYWDGAEFNTTEAMWSWTAAGDIAAGTVVTLNGLGNGQTASSNLGAVSFTSESNRDIGNGNEVVYAYVGEPTTPTAFLSAVANDDFGSHGQLTNTGLMVGETAVQFRPKDNDADIAEYAGRRVSITSFDELRALINNLNNWTMQDGGGDNSSDGTDPDIPFSTEAFAVDPQANAVSFAAGSLIVTEAEGDAGTTTLTFTVERTGSTDGALDFSGRIETGGIVSAEDFGGTLPTAFTGTIPVGASSASVSVEVSGDTLFEQDEPFSLLLESATNAVTPAYVADSNAVATGVIANDDAQPVDIAFVGYCAEGSESLAFVALGGIPAGTTIWFTDRRWNGDTFDTNEGTWSWTAESDVPAGSIVTMDGLGNGQEAESNFGSIVFEGTTRPDLSRTQEVVYAYLGEADAPTAFVTAIGTIAFEEGNSQFYGDLKNTGLVQGVTALSTYAVSPNGIDIGAYVGPRSGLAVLEDFKALINDPANWDWQTYNYDQSQDGLFPDLPFSRQGFAADANPQEVEFAAASLEVSQAEGDAGMVDIAFTVQRSGTEGDLDFWGAFKAGDTDADDFGGLLPTGFSGTILAGETSTTVTITVSGDILYELDESFTLELLGSDNASAASVVGEAAIATGIIANDEVPQVVQFAADSVSVYLVEGDAGTTVLTFTIGRDGGTSGDVDFSGSFIAGDTDAEDFGGILPTGFSGTIPDGQSSAEITLEFAGDLTVEADETFTLSLDSVSNVAAPVKVGGKDRSTVTVENDEPLPKIAFVGYNSDGSDNLSFVALGDITAGTTIWFTDNEWTGSSFNSGEGIMRWTADADVAAGTVISMSDLIGTPTSNLGSLDVTLPMNLSGTSEAVFAYVGEADDPAVFLTALAIHTFEIAGSGSTLDGTGLTIGVDAISFTPVDAHCDIAEYVGPRYGAADIADYEALINDPTNWVTQDSGGDQSNDGIAPDVPFSTVPFTDDPNVQVIGFAADSLEVSEAEGDAGTRFLTFTVERSGSTTGDLDFSGDIAVAGVVDASDFGGSLPTSFSGTIPDGATSATVTVEVAGDTLFEQNESFTLTLKSAENASVLAYVNDDEKVATGIISNDDPVTADIAFVGLNADGGENIAFVALGDIAAGTTIHFTDQVWDGEAFAGGESAWSWTATGDISAGTIVTMDGLAAGQKAVSNLGEIVFTDESQRDIESAREVVYAYVGAPSEPTAFLTAISNAYFWDGNTAAFNRGTLAGTGLVEGVNAMVVPEGADIAEYAGPREGFPSLEDYREALHNSANWTAQERDFTDESQDGIDPDVPFDATAFTADPSAQLVQFASDSLAVSQAEGDAGTTELTFTLERSGSTLGTLEFSGSLVKGRPGEEGYNSGGTLTDADFDGGLPMTFSGSFADGETVATVTVSVAGDTLFEPDETFSLLLESASNSQASVAVGGRSVASGTIVDDDARTPDIAFVGFDALGEQAFTFMAVTEIAAGTVIQFSDKTWYGDHFSTDPDNGSVWTWTADGDIAAGQVISMEMLNGAAPASNLGTITREGSGKISYDPNDPPVIYAYIGEADAPNSFVSAATTGNGFPSRLNEAGDGSISALAGTGLTSGVDAVGMRIGSVGYFDGPHGGHTSMEGLKALINEGNWSGLWRDQTDGVNDLSQDGMLPDGPLPALAYTTDPAAQIVGFADEPLQAKPEKNDGEITTYTFTVARSGGTEGEVSFTGRVLVGSYAEGHPVTAEDFGGTAPTFAGVIPDGETSVTVTIEVSGDTVYEAEETFFVELVSIENSAGAPVAAGTYHTQGIIIDFDEQPASIKDGEVLTQTIQVEGGESFTVEAGGKLIVPNGDGFAWVSDGVASFENYGYVGADNVLGQTSQGAFTVNNHAGGILEGEWDPHGSILPGTTITVNNAGEITNDGRTFDFHDVIKGGGEVVINNLAGGVITQSGGGGTDMMRPGGRGDDAHTIINNWGTISMEEGSAGGGDAIDYQDNTGGVVNNYTGGWIEGSRHAVTGDDPVAVFNDVGATMIGRNGSAVNLDTGSSEADRVYVTNRGTMEGRSAELDDSDGDAIDVDGLLHLDNYGEVLGLGHNGYHDGEPNISEAIAAGGAIINNYAGGTLYGYGRAIQIDDSENGSAFSATVIYNEGLIQGDGNAPEDVDEEDVAPYDPVGSEAVNLVGDWDDELTNMGAVIGGVKMDGGNDTLVNEGSMSALRGTAVDLGDGDDTLSGGGTIDGDVDMGAGDDTVALSFGGSVSGTLYLGDGADKLSTVASDLTVDASLGDDTVMGGRGVESVLGGEGNDLLSGDRGNDTLDGGLGDDHLDGGRDHDIVTGGEGADTLLGDRGDDSLDGGLGDDHLDGGRDDDLLTGDAGEDSLLGDRGDDTLDGGRDDDHLDGGRDDDLLLGGHGFDLLLGDRGDDTLKGGVGDDTLDGGRDNDFLIGAKGDDVLLGDRENDTLNGGLGDDYLDGGYDEDRLIGGAGDDTLLGDRGNDTLRGGADDDSLDGGYGQDRLLGEDGDDVLDGGRDNDTLDGGLGDDSLTGGEGDDLFVFSAGSGFDEVMDFEPGDDMIQLNGFSVQDFDSLLETASEEDGDVVFVLDEVAGDQLTLVGIDLEELSQDDFMFKVA